MSYYKEKQFGIKQFYSSSPKLGGFGEHRLRFEHDYITTELIYECFSSKNNMQPHIKTRRCKTWWDRLKKDCMPKWFVKRFPVEYDEKTTRIDLSVEVHYPEFNKAMPLGMPVVRLNAFSGGRELYDSEPTIGLDDKDDCGYFDISVDVEEVK
jgi:hypothetical protein